MSTKMLGVIGRGSGRQNSIPTIPTVPTISTPWGCSKLKLSQDQSISSCMLETLLDFGLSEDFR